MGFKKFLKEWKKKKKKSVTFMIVPQYHGNPKSFTCTLGLLAIVLLITLCLFGYNLYMFCTYNYALKHALDLKNLNDDLRKQNNSIAPAIKQQEIVNKDLAILKEQYRKLYDSAENLSRKTGRKFSLPSRGLSFGLGRERAVILKSVRKEQSKIIRASVVKENALVLQEELERQKKEAGFLKETLAALNIQVDHTPSIWPLYGRITSRFSWSRLDPVTKRTYRSHMGIDIHAPIGTLVRATAHGVVTFAAYNGGYGYKVEINHGYGVKTVYAHLSRIIVYPGQKVKKGTVVAYSGSTGHSTGPHLHYEVRIGGRAVNPAPYLYW
ncbi:MAG: M23 family metallopeptidase [Bacillota bacterium]